VSMGGGRFGISPRERESTTTFHATYEFSRDSKGMAGRRSPDVHKAVVALIAAKASC
jgi:hypothetical protein